MKDNFSARSADYALFRPGYPPALFHFLFKKSPGFDLAWECASGNGQIAAGLAKRFRQVVATDVSEAQLAFAIQRPNIEYRREPAEAPSFLEKSLDLITVGQAAHWFDLEKFYPEAQQALRPGGVLALVGYSLPKVDDETDEVIRYLYHNILGE